MCVWALRVYRYDSMLLVARLLLVLPGPVESAHDLGRFGCVLAELRAMVCGMVCVSVALLNGCVPCARLQLVVACGCQKRVGLIRTELRSSEDP